MITLNFMCDGPSCGSNESVVVDDVLTLRARLPVAWRHDSDGRIYCPRPACKAARREAMGDEEAAS